VWQALRRELYPRGLEIVTVALDTGGAAAAREWIEAAQPEHPSLIDQAHLLDELFGVVNVPSGIWIDEDGIIVRPPEPAYAARLAALERAIPADATPAEAARLRELKKLRLEPETYVAALRDWVAHGAQSRYALSPQDVLRRSRPRPIEEATAAAHFELAQQRYRDGHVEDAVVHFRAAHRLQPDNWTYKRQAWHLDDGPTRHYDGDLFTHVNRSASRTSIPPSTCKDGRRR
jgi:hypothetical protein